MGDEALVGRLLDDRYRVGERIARGGMASVFLGTDERLDRQVAIKVMHRGLGDPAAFTERFKREAKAAAKLNHRNVVSVFDQGHDGDAIYLVMEYVPGHTLRDVMREESPMAPLRAMQLIEPVLVALATAHRAGLIHRDVKPENVLIKPDGDIKVADFGLARAVSTATTATSNTLIGTVSYLAPEIVSNTGTDARSDIYAVGAMLFEMLTGQKPHAGESPIQVAYKHVHEDIGPPSALVSTIPPYVDALIARATVRDITRRAADASVMLQYVRLVTDALRDGVEDDPELTAHLLPSADPAPAPARESAAAAGVAPPARPGGGDTHEPTVQWRMNDEERGSVATPPLARKVESDQQTAERRPVRRGRVLLIAALVLAAVAAALGYYLGVGRYVDAPVLIGMAERQAEGVAGDLGFTFKVTERRFSEDEPAGTVISTEPGAGDRILPGGTIEAVVSKGPERYQVPKLAGEALDEAKNLLSDNKLKLGKVRKAFSETFAKNEVIRIEGLKPGQDVRKGTAVNLVVSKGREPVTMPNVEGQKSKPAYDAINAAGLEARLVFAFSDDVKKGIVISQSPSEGPVFRGDTITLTVSKGPDIVKVPNVIGMSKTKATALLKSGGFNVRYIDGDAFKSYEKVVIQLPQAGSEVKRGSDVIIGG